MAFDKTEKSERDRLLAETDWLAEHLHDPDLRVVDIRGYVRTVQRETMQEALYIGALEEYEQGHIPGAVYLDWTRDIVDLQDPVEAQVALPETFAQAMERVGIGDQHLVVIYDSHPASQFATRLWWALTYYGHQNTMVLNGGFPKWQREERPLTTEIPVYPSASFTPVVQPALRATAQEVLLAIGQPEILLVDARDRGQYIGEITRGHGRAGHIPSAINLPREELIAADGTFRSDEELRQIVAQQQIEPGERIIAYCNGGVAATSLLFSLAMLGYPRLTNYDGSWNEWGSRSDLPVEVVH